MGPYDYNLNLCRLQSRPNTRTMGNPMPESTLSLLPESTLSPSQGLRLWPLKSSQAEIGKNVLGENSTVRAHCTAYMSHKDNPSNMEDNRSLYNVL
jgi:hypothetical protein